MLIFDSMNENLDPTDSNFNTEEIEIDKALRPLSFDDFAGQNQILDKEDISYLTIFKMTSVIDWGPVLDMRQIRLDGYIPEIFKRITDAGVVAIRKIVEDLLAGIDILDNNETNGKPGKIGYRRTPNDSIVKLNELETFQFDQIYRLVRCLTGPYPRLQILLDNENKKIFNVEAVVRINQEKTHTFLTRKIKDYENLILECEDAVVIAVGSYGKKNDNT